MTAPLPDTTDADRERARALATDVTQRAQIAAAFAAIRAEAQAEQRERDAKIADVYADTKPNLEKSTNAATAKVIATIMSDTGAKIAAAIREQQP